MLSAIGIQPISLLGQIVSFLIFYFVFKKFLFRPILENLEKRAKQQAKAMRAAEDTIRIQEELKDSEKNLKQKLQKQIQAEFAKASTEAKQRKEEMIQEARQEAKKAAQQEYEVYTRKLQEKEQEVKSHLAELVVQATRKTLSEHLDKKTSQQIVAQQIKKLKTMKL